MPEHFNTFYFIKYVLILWNLILIIYFVIRIKIKVIIGNKIYSLLLLILSGQDWQHRPYSSRFNPDNPSACCRLQRPRPGRKYRKCPRVRGISEWGRRTATASGPGGATVSARAIDRITYLPAAAAEHPPSARLSARRRLQPGQFSPLHGYRLARRLPERPRGPLLAHRGAAGERTRPKRASLPREVPAARPRLRPKTPAPAPYSSRLIIPATLPVRMWVSFLAIDAIIRCEPLPPARPPRCTLDEGRRPINRLLTQPDASAC